MSKPSQSILVVISLFVLIVQFYFILKNKEEKDFKIYYYAVVAYENNLNIYDIPSLNKVTSSEKKITLPFLYPIHTLIFFKIFSHFDINKAYIFYQTIKLIFIILFFYLFYLYWIPKNLIGIFFIYGLTCFSGSILVDFRAGNVVIFEQFFIWLGMYYFLKKKYLLFVISIILASYFKVIPIIFLSLLLFTNYKNRFKLLLISSIVYMLIFILTYLIDKVLFISFLKSFSQGKTNARGALNPTLNSFIRDFNNYFGLNEIGLIISLSTIITLSIYLIIIFLTFRTISEIKEREEISFYYIVLMIITIYTILIPRMMFYNYFIMILPSFIILLSIKQKFLKIILYMLLIFPSFYFLRYFLKVPEPNSEVNLLLIPLEYFNLIMALTIWTILITKKEMVIRKIEYILNFRSNQNHN